jgi:hypothetical protein
MDSGDVPPQMGLHSESREAESSGEYLMIRGEPVRHVRFGTNANFEISAPGFNREAIDVTVLSKQRQIS